MTISRLHAVIAQLIAASPYRGWSKGDLDRLYPLPCITFQQYMDCCLYNEQDGYYRSGEVRTGRQGDFYTSSYVGDVLARILAKHVIHLAEEATEPLQLIEWGAGAGRLSVQIRKAGIASFPEWDAKVSHVLIEDHPLHLQAAQQLWRSTFSTDCMMPLLLTSEQAWSHHWNQELKLVIANELLDAFPVHRVEQTKDGLMELGVSLNKDLSFEEILMPISDDSLSCWLEREEVRLEEGAQTEINAAAAEWVGRLASIVPRGRAILIDYGHSAEEYVAAHRRLGTLMCYYKHQAGVNPYIRAGKQDITAHVPFTMVQHAAEASGWRLAAYTTQKQFLVDNGVLELLQEHQELDPFSSAARENRAIRQLLLSDSMSESFKVMILERG